jgi:hypothetical protein
MESLNLRLIYDGAGPLIWSRKPNDFGLQDKAGLLHLGDTGLEGWVTFHLTLHAKRGSSAAPVLTGEFAHGPPAGRFLYLGWRNEQGAFAQRLKLPLSGITWSDVRGSHDRQQPLIGTLVDHHPRVTSTGANIGGTRPMCWTLP